MKKSTGLIVVAALAVGGLFAYGCYQREIGRREATIKARDAAIASLRARATQRDTVYVRTRDTLRLVRTRTDSILQRDTLRLTDTLVHVDTLVQIVERERLACDAVISSCEVRVAIRDTLIDSLRVQLSVERGKDRLPLLNLKLPSRTASLGFGFAAGVATVLLLEGRR